MIALIRSLIGIGSVTYGDDGDELQRLQVTEKAIGRGYSDRVTDDVPAIHAFGFSSMPPIGAEAVMIRRGGDRAQSIVIGTSHRASRPRGLEPGDTCLYDVRGRRVLLSADGIDVDAAGGPVTVRNATTILLVASDTVTIDAPTVRFTGNAQVGGDLGVTGKIAGGGLISAGGDVEARAGAVSLDGLHDAYAAHAHGGVKAGGDTSGATTKPV